MSDKVNRLSLPASETLSAEEKTLTETLAEFQVVRFPVLRSMFLIFPVFVALCLMVDYWSGTKFFSKNPDITTGYITAAVTSALFCGLWNQVVTTLKRLYERGAVRDSTGATVAPQEYASFLKGFERILNHWAGFVLSAVILIFQAFNPYTDLYKALTSPTLANFIWFIRVILGVLTWFFLGSIVWRLVGIAYLAFALPRQFHLRVQASHPDRCGGLQPVGELYLHNAVIMVIPASYFLIYEITVFLSLHLTKPEWNLDSMIKLFQGDDFLQASAFFTLIALGVSLLPIYRVHQEMAKQSDAHQERLDTLAEEIIQLHQDLLPPTQGNASTDAKTKMDSLKLKEEVYAENDTFPVWPLNVGLLSKLMVTWSLPVLNFLGFSAPVKDAFVKTLSCLFVSTPNSC